MGILSKEGEKNAEGREYGASEAYGPFSPDEMARVHELVDEIGLQKARGFIVVVKRKTLVEDEDHEQTEVDGTVKVSRVNRKFMLDSIFHALGMDNKEIIEYVTMRAVMGSDFDDAH